MKCPNCGEKMPNKMTFCGFCGSNLKTGETSWAVELEERAKAREEKEAREARRAARAKEREAKLAAESNAQNTQSAPVPPVTPPPVQPAPAKPVISDMDNLEVPQLNKPAVPPVPPQPVADVRPAPVPPTITPAPAPVKPIISDIDSLEVPQLNKPSVPPVAPVPPQPVADVRPAPVPPTITPTAPPVKPIISDIDSLEVPQLNKPSVPPVPPQPVPDVKPAPVPPTVKPIAADIAEVPEIAPMAEPVIEKVKVPDVSNTDKKGACEKLESLGLKVRTIRKNSETVPRGCIISQNIPVNTEVTPGTEIVLTISVGTWCEWTTEPLAAEKLQRYDVEEKREYRFRTRTHAMEYKESSNPEEEGYILYDKKHNYSEWVNDEYYTNRSKNTSETFDIISNLIGYKYCGWIYTGSEKKDMKIPFATLETALFFNKDTSESDWTYQENIMYNNIAKTEMPWTLDDEAFIKTPAGDTSSSNIKVEAYLVEGTYYALKCGSLETEWYKYKKRELLDTTYFYQKEVLTPWGEWSEWSDRGGTPNELTEFECRTVYRYKRKETL